MALFSDYLGMQEITPLMAFEPITMFIALLVLNVFATVKTIRHTEGAALPLWLAFIWIVQGIGGILALVAIRKTAIEAPVETTTTTALDRPSV